MPDKVAPALPPAIDELQKEAKRVGEKRNAATENGASPESMQALDEQLEGLKVAIASAIVAEAEREITDAKIDAAAVKDGGGAKVAMGPDQQRIAAVKDEMQRIADKLKEAEKNGAKPADTKPIKDQLAGLKKDLAAAAIAAAKRELKAAKQEAKDIKDGKSPKPKPPEKGPGPEPQGGNGGSGSGGGSGGAGSGGGGGSSGSGSDSGGDGSGTTLGKGGTHTEKDALVIFVKSERTVWAWSRRDQAWVPYHFNSKILEVKRIANGIFVYAEHGAALFDVVFGQWLKALDTGQETVLGGEAS